MRRLPAIRRLLASLALCALGAAAQVPAQAASPCAKLGSSSPERARCEGERFAAEESRLATYLTAAQQKARKMDDGDRAPDLAVAQRAWQAYRDAHCGDVYLYWLAGTYRYEAAFDCNLQLTRERMHDLWVAYLTYPDGTPPDLPEP